MARLSAQETGEEGGMLLGLLKGKTLSTKPSPYSPGWGTQEVMLLLPFKEVPRRCHSTRDPSPSPPCPLLLPCPCPGCQDVTRDEGWH